MRKFELEYLRDRVRQVVQCTNGAIATKLNKRLNSTALSNDDKFKLIAEGKAVIKPVKYLMANNTRYDTINYYDLIVRCYEYPETTTQKAAAKKNKELQDRIEELQNHVELEGRMLIDRVVLGTVKMEDVPEELHKLGNLPAILIKD